MVNIEQIVQVCDATMWNNWNTARLKRLIANFYAAKSINRIFTEASVVIEYSPAFVLKNQEVNKSATTNILSLSPFD